MTTMHLVHELPVVIDSRGVPYTAAVMGSLAEDGLWDGFIELRGEDGSTLTTPLETRQSNLADLVYWSTGLSEVYLEGALSRARRTEEEPPARVLQRGLRNARKTRPTRDTTKRARAGGRGRAAPSRSR